jgi:Putative homoserine kinase type II (protein kinase fold)
MTDSPARMEALEFAVHRALARYEFSAEATVTPVNISENTTYRIDDPVLGRSAALRVHRPSYHRDVAIESELCWMDALSNSGVVEVPRPIRARDGARVTKLQLPDGSTRSVVLFEWLTGAPPTPDSDLVPHFRVLGTLAAAMHQHGAHWVRPEWFERYTCDCDAGLGPKPMWGRWCDGLGVGPSERRLLGRLDSEIRDRLARYGTAPDRFGLAHNDLRLANLLVDGEHTRVIDFDDCGFAWYMYEFASSVSFVEDDERLADWMESWLQGYAEHRPLDPADVSILPTLIMFRRLLLVGWIGSHHEYAPEAAELGAAFTAATCNLAEAYLCGRYLC